MRSILFTGALAHGAVLWGLVGVLLSGSGCRCGSPSGDRGASRRQPQRPDGGAPVPVEVGEWDAGVVLPVVREKEPNNWPEQAMQVRARTAIRGTIGYPLTGKLGDRDVYCFSVAGPGRQTLRAELTGVPRLRVQLTVRTSGWGTVHTVQSVAPGRGLIVANLTLQPGKYCFVVSEARGGPPFHFNRKKAYSLSYRIEAAIPGEEREPNNKFYTANILVPGTEIRGLLGRRGDRDWYRVPLGSLPRGSLLAVRFVGVPGVTADVEVLNWTRKRRIVRRRGTRGSSIDILDLKVPLHTGVFYVVVTGHRRFNPDERYRLSVRGVQVKASREVEPNDTPRSAVVIRGRQGRVRGRIEVPRDVDYYYLPLAGSANVRLRLDVPAGLDARLAVLSLRGRKLGEANFGKVGEPELLTNVRARVGVRIRVAGVGRSSDAKRSYRLHWKTEPADRGDEREPNGSARTANLIVPGVSARGYIYPKGDVDLYRFRLPGSVGSTEKIHISVQGIPKVRLAIFLLDDQQNVLARSSASTSEGLREITTSLHAAKSYYIRIRDQHNRRVNPNDNYELNLARVRR